MSELSVMNAMLYASANAGGFVTMANRALAAAQAAATNVGYDGVDWVPIIPVRPPDKGIPPVAPTIEPPVLELPDDPGPAPDVIPTSPIDAGPVPIDRNTAPHLEFAIKPSQLGPAPSAPTINTGFAFPEPPAALTGALPEAPVFGERLEPSKPEINLPEFMGRNPENVPDAPTDGVASMDAAYATQSLNSQTNADAYVDQWMDKNSPGHRVQMGLLTARLNALMEGGTGIKPAVEDAIYSRAREKNDREAARVRDAGYAEAASRGFTLPSGALMSGIARARQEAANNNLKAASDIVAMQAELEQKNLQFAVTTTIGLRTAMVSAATAYMGHVVSINGQAMDYAKSVFANIVELYNASVRVYSARVEAYKGYVAVYEAQIRGAMAKLDIYKGEIAALEAMTNVDRARADIYRARIDAISSLIGLYKAQIEAVLGRVTLEKTKLEIFQAQTQAYGAQAQAKNAEWSGYSAAMAGEETKAKIYSAQIAAFGTQVEAYKATIAALSAEQENITKSNAANAANYSALVQGYSAHVNAESERSRAHNDNNKAVLSAFDKEIAIFAGQTQLNLAQYKAENEAKVQNATGDLSAQVESARAKTQFGVTLAQLSNDGAKIYGQLAGAAMAGINTLSADVNNS